MDALNADCLIEIIKLLNLKDQIAIYHVNSSLQMVVTSLWLKQYKHVHINFLEVSLTNLEFQVFLSNIQDVVQILHLRFLTQEKYEIMKEFSFKRVMSFRFTLMKPYFMEDSDIKDLRKMMPNLKAFSPHGNLTGLYMDEWSTLKELNLSFCLQLDMLRFQTLLNHLKLEKLKLNIFPNNNQFEQMNLGNAQLDHLKYLELNTYEFYYFLTKPLKALKELVITNHYNPRQLFDVLLSIWQANQIYRVETSNIDNILVNCLEMRLNIEQLTIVNDENPLPQNIIPSLHLLTDLRKLRFRNCIFNARDFRNLLKNTPQLHEISFEYCQFDTPNICVRVEEVVANHTQKLRLNMFENRLMDSLDRPVWSRMDEIVYVSVDFIGNHNNLLEVSHLEGEDLCYEPLHVVYR